MKKYRVLCLAGASFVFWCSVALADISPDRQFAYNYCSFASAFSRAVHNLVFDHSPRLTTDEIEAANRIALANLRDVIQHEHRTLGFGPLPASRMSEIIADLERLPSPETLRERLLSRDAFVNSWFDVCVNEWRAAPSE